MPAHLEPALFVTKITAGGKEKNQSALAQKYREFPVLFRGQAGSGGCGAADACIRSTVSLSCRRELSQIRILQLGTDSWHWHKTDRIFAFYQDST